MKEEDKEPLEEKNLCFKIVQAIVYAKVTQAMKRMLSTEFLLY